MHMNISNEEKIASIVMDLYKKAYDMIKICARSAMMKIGLTFK